MGTYSGRVASRLPRRSCHCGARRRRADRLFCHISRTETEANARREELRVGTAPATLRTSRLILRSLEISDEADVFAVFSDPMVTRYWDGATMTTLQDAANYIDHIHHGFRRRELFQWG